MKIKVNLVELAEAGSFFSGTISDRWKRHLVGFLAEAPQVI